MTARVPGRWVRRLASALLAGALLVPVGPSGSTKAHEEAATTSPAAGPRPAGPAGIPCGAGALLALRDPPATGEGVQALQHVLGDLGYDPGPADGIFGPRTAAAVRRLQEDHHLVADGAAGPRTWSALTEALRVLPRAPYDTPVPGTLEVAIDLSRFRLTVLVNGYPYRSYPVGIGTGRTPSPVGEWRVIHKAKNWGGGFGTRWLGLDVPWGIYGIHGTNQPGSIGRRASHGCIRMLNRHVEELYEIVPRGTRVVIFGQPVLSRRTLVQGHTGADVVEVQMRLRELGFYTGPIDGRFGPGTAAAVRALQKARGLKPTGIVRWETYKALGLTN
ncbi:L,D-transpeptidase family protein [Caldinitratiruptor microaerophilus]|uniref:ErfK/YbiS/YcfS/YnhG protein n=1 Tax=Caldinitratiruptor microaerophilus TaxID=671077 RepID=A0AA35CPA6_9FIRM|nr:peptidoglycan-binding protein [Caldinitratiruptor microaerophilus]BDG62293.1 ErfK/YbiS/YcfS/YnhG protein [Caldinitratiruptor microaerophilus]